MSADDTSLSATSTDATSKAGGSGKVVEVELAQGLGLMEALTIGVGTMIGAGIFVLPGFILTETGPAASIAFLIGGVVALLTALSAAEIATGMPKSGGGYYFVSRAFGPMWGAIIGWSTWFGLIFASAFYMMGFGEYVATFIGVSPSVLALGMTVGLTILNITGSKGAGQAQNFIVGLLAVILFVFMGWSIPNANPTLVTGDFAPMGWGAVVGGTATLFVTYCGFAGIASMAEEIKEPAKNLPRALLGSVISVTVLYVALMLIVAALRPYSELGGSTIVADLADELMGGWGRWMIMVGAIMATVSSANASIMAASRISFAMGRDRLIWGWLNEVHPKFRVPHRAIAVTGVLTAAITFFGNIELLAEVSGFLHLVLYGLMSIACIILRRADLDSYKPVFQVPLFPWLPIIGALATFSVIFFMGPLTLIIGGGLIAFALLHYFVMGRRRTNLEGAWPLFLRNGVLEPALAQVEKWGAVEEELPTTMVPVANPEHEEARLHVAAAMMGPSKGRVLAVNVFRVPPDEDMSEAVFERYYQTIEQRNERLQAASKPVREAGGEATSHVLISPSVFQALLSAAETSHSSTVILGWPQPGEGREKQMKLFDSLDRHLRSHLLVLKDREPIPAPDLLAIIDNSRHGELALLAATRMANEWNANLTVGTVLPEDAGQQHIDRVEEDLDERIGDTVRANIRAIISPSLVEAAHSEAAHHDMLVVGSSAVEGADGIVTPLIDQLDDIPNCSMLLARAREGLELR